MTSRGKQFIYGAKYLSYAHAHWVNYGHERPHRCDSLLYQMSGKYCLGNTFGMFINIYSTSNTAYMRVFRSDTYSELLLFFIIEGVACIVLYIQNGQQKQCV